ncbi:hypothetical protein CNMCM5793_004608 [Aspergillus hiratsukae]|uniref:Uncharacterized protein n=1 Tax=Aspergillus hiratsukae TaxID=1194566 RepID=A0A8H6QDL7_9EURO|nr:hypothetical protein CNMCM5793_004608 [Aspergillus hiratsukae]KAF7170076.1 hypothetical protein CNMCM6106_004899 [Aspergillus hiratsukae]
MPSLSQILSAALAITAVNAAMGPAFSTGPVASNSFIREATSTLVVPSLVSNNRGDLSLWVGMGTSNGDLIQSIAEKWQSNGWTAYAYTLMSTGPNGQYPIQAPGGSANPGDHITMHYKFDDATGNYTHDGHALGWGSAVECAATDCGTVGAHSWIDTKIILDVADPNYKNTNGKGQGVTGEMSTSDGGKTWTVCSSFGTLNRFGAHSEHERITRAALHCSGTSSDGTCFEPDSLDKLAGKTGTWGAVGAPDWNDLCTPEAHFDDADFSDTPGYPQSREQATEALERTIAYLHGRLDEALAAASGMLNHDSQIAVETGLPLVCDFLKGLCQGTDPKAAGNAKCSVLAGFGAALHGFQDFYSHSNWGDSELTSDAVDTPGLRQVEPAPFLDVWASKGLSNANIPENLTTECYHDPVTDSPNCSDRITHKTLNKDLGIIDPVSGATSSPTTERGQYDGNFNAAVQLAIQETRRQWSNFTEQLVSTYG